jgi:2-keto-4-pentenoate hydratase/2-oxohepta-3-ene-1,7-dioic acid hydratase in catechol pathway
VFVLETLPQGVAIAQGGAHLPLVAAGARLGIRMPGASLFELVAAWPEVWPAIQAIAERAAFVPELWLRDGQPVPQFGAARKVICAGANYYQHLAEMDVKLVKDAARPPFFFLKPPTALVGPGRTVPVDPAIQMLDWEVELAVIIGRPGHRIAAARALDHVAGYTVAIDVTARDRLLQPESIFKFDFFAGKGQDGFCPTAFGMLPAAFLPDPQATRLRLAVNGALKQDASTDDMVYSVAEVVAWASTLCTLEPGDVVLTGSPAGVGYPRREFLRAGDTMRAEVDPLLGVTVELFAREAAP